MPNGDFNVTFDLQGHPVETEQMRYLEGFGLPAQQTVSSGATQYLHGDLIRSTMLTTGQGGTAVSAVSYTAFGELIGTAPETRYQYAGGWGYEADLLVLEGAPGTAPITLQHVGFRWYDPSIGRFIQRDPIGIFGGLNVYEYVRSNPLGRVDPLGLYSLVDPKFKLREWLKWIVAGGSGGAAAGAKTKTLKGLAIGAGLGVIGGAVGYPLWWTGETTCVRIADTAEALGQLEEQNRKNRRQREDNPEVFPPWEPPIVNPPPEVPCGHPW